MGSRWPLSNSVLFDLNGQLAAGALIRFYEAGTTTPMAVYRDAAETTPHTNPVVATAIGIAPLIFVPYRAYGVRVTSADGALLFSEDNVPNPAPPSSGGGSGIVVTSDMVLQTGDPIWRLRTGTLAGFVRMNARTIGNAASGATERANADTENLFAFLWNNLADSIATVSSGRGASASADFAAGKTLVIPTMQGFVAGGLDDMGASAANRVQASTTINTTNGSTSATVASAADLGIGMVVISANVPIGATITDISGTTITLSAGATATASGTAARFSYFGDAQQVGGTAGAATKSQRAKEVAAHQHTGTTNNAGSHSHQTTASNSGTAIPVGSGGGTVPAYSGGGTNTSTAGDHNHTFTTDNAGNGLPMLNLQPTRLGTFYMKL